MASARRLSEAPPDMTSVYPRRGRCSLRTRLSDHAGDHPLEPTLIHQGRARRRRTELDLERQENAPVLERAHDPVESAEEHRSLAVRVGVLRPIDGAEQSAEPHADILVGPAR